MNTGLGAARFISCIARTPTAAGARPSPVITKLEKARNTPAVSPAPRAAARISQPSRVPVAVPVVIAAPVSCGPESTAPHRSTIHAPIRFGSCVIVSTMDDLAALLDGPRARGAFTLQVVMTAPWGLDVRDQAPLSVLAVTAGEAWVRIDGEPPSVLRPGDVALVRGTRAVRGRRRPRPRHLTRPTPAGAGLRRPPAASTSTRR